MGQTKVVKVFRNLVPYGFLLLLVPAIPAQVGEGCTVAVVSGKATPDGRPLLWKNRDTKAKNNKVLAFKGQGIPFLGLVTAGKHEREEVWAGINAAGFAIMNSASNDQAGKGGDGEGRFMLRALTECRTVADFAGILEKTNGPGRAVLANFGVIDGQGGAAMFETGQHRFCRFDANDPVAAPWGFVVRANFGFTGVGKGSGFGRYERACRLFRGAAKEKQLDCRFILKTAARDLFTFLRNPYPLSGKEGLPPLDTSITISRRSTVSASLFHGVKPGENPLRACYWVILGHPTALPAIPLFVVAGPPHTLVQGKPGGEAGLWTGAKALYDGFCVPGKTKGLLRLDHPVFMQVRQHNQKLENTFLSRALGLRQEKNLPAVEAVRAFQTECLLATMAGLRRAQVQLQGVK